MGYIREIRQKVGHDEILCVGAGVWVYQNGQLLLQRRRDNGCRGMHGGCVELGEEVEAAARREPASWLAAQSSSVPSPARTCATPIPTATKCPL